MADAVQPRNPSVGTAMRRTAREEVENGPARARGEGISLHGFTRRAGRSRGRAPSSALFSAREPLRMLFCPTRASASQFCAMPPSSLQLPRSWARACARVGKRLAPIAFERRSQWDTRSGEDLLPPFTARLESLILFCET